jgi:CrcB protein
VLAVAAGGAVGSALRFGVSHAVRAVSAPGGWPIATFTVNVLGALALGWFLARTTGASAAAPSETARAFVVIGLLGGFTTFSAFSGELLAFVYESQFARAGVYAALSVTLAVAATMLGFTLARATS